MRLLERALTLQPDYAEAYFNLGNVLISVNRREEALPRFHEALRLRPDYADAYLNLGTALFELRRPSEGAIFLRQAIRLRPEHPPGHNQLGLVLAAEGAYSEAQACYHRALKIQPRYPEAHSNLGNLYQEQGRLEEALACYELALWLDPESTTTRWNRALSLLQNGDFEHGWQEYEWRWQRKQTPARSMAKPRWDGLPLEGRTILLYTEQGLGDTFMFVRYATLVKKQGGAVILECPAFLQPLLRSCPGIDQLVPEGTPLPDHDVQAPLMSLPALLHTTLATVPDEVPYLFADAERSERWRERLQDIDGFKVGIVWQGNPHHPLDHYRSIPLGEFARLAAVPGVRLVRLQRGVPSEALACERIQFPLTDLGDDVDKEGGAFMDTAAIMRNLDLVISVDTATAHLAGALGLPVWLPLCAVGEWRWLTERADTPWYPTMQLFRQSTLGEWRPVFKSMAASLSILGMSRHL
jgi:Flp pilus assembly protein TadD